ncbi:DNA adenine methylase [Thiomonas sp.]
MTRRSRPSRSPRPLSRPVLRFFGSKWRIAPFILRHCPPHRVYVEPYGGGGSILLRKPRAVQEVYNDIHSEVVNLFRVLRDPALAVRLQEVCVLTPYAREELMLAFDVAQDPVERARRLLVRSWFGLGQDTATGGRRHYSTLNTRVSQAGVHYAQLWAQWPLQIAAFTQRLAGVVIENREALEVIARHDGAQTLIYADPPYVREARGLGGYADEMNDAEHAGLAERLHAAQAMVLLSGYASPLYDRLYADWERVELATRAHNLGRRLVARIEVLWLNPACAAALRAAEVTEVAGVAGAGAEDDNVRTTASPALQPQGVQLADIQLADQT